MTPRTASPILVVGTGLLGASIGLALREKGVDVLLSDQSPSTCALAVDYGAGRGIEDTDEPTIVVVAVPPEFTAAVVVAQLEAWPTAIVTDVASVKKSVLDEVLAAGGDVSRYVGSHPMAGRERGGAMSARADLFIGRPWVIAAHALSRDDAVEAVEKLILDVDAVPLRLDAEDHDRAVARISHAPQVIATLLAKQLLDASPRAVGLAGQGVRDTTRIAASDAELWLQVLSANAGPVVEVLRAFSADLSDVIGSLDDVDAPGARKCIADEFEAGNRGVARLPGKHGVDTRFSSIIVMVDDRPGELARLLTEIGEAGINLEDLRLEHSPGAPIGLAEIWVTPELLDALVGELKERGWRIAS